MAKIKRGFYWFNESGEINGATTSPPKTMVNPTGRIFHLESLRVFLGMTPLSNDKHRVDLNCQINHTNGQFVDIVVADRYGQTAGIADVQATRYYATPWVFSAKEGIVVSIYSGGEKGYQWGVLIHADGYVEQ